MGEGGHGTWSPSSIPRKENTDFLSPFSFSMPYIYDLSTPISVTRWFLSLTHISQPRIKSSFITQGVLGFSFGSERKKGQGLMSTLTLTSCREGSSGLWAKMLELPQRRLNMTTPV